MATMVSGDVSHAMLALERANEVRIERAALKREVAAGRVQPSDVLANPPAYARTMKVYDLLRAIPGCGEVKALSAMARCKVPPSTRIHRLTDRQRSVLVEALERYAAGERMPTGPWQTTQPTREYPSGRCIRCGEEMRNRGRMCGFCIAETGGV